MKNIKMLFALLTALFFVSCSSIISRKSEIKFTNLPTKDAFIDAVKFVALSNDFKIKKVEDSGNSPIIYVKLKWTFTIRVIYVKNQNMVIIAYRSVKKGHNLLDRMKKFATLLNKQLGNPHNLKVEYIKK
jgi:PBP1b-binding outer membrane lipoprotein LpoB